MNFSTCIFSDSPCQLSELSSDSNQRSSVDGQSVSYDSVRSLSVSDVELGLKLVTESNSNNYRLRRIIEINWNVFVILNWKVIFAKKLTQAIE